MMMSEPFFARLPFHFTPALSVCIRGENDDELQMREMKMRRKIRFFSSLLAASGLELGMRGFRILTQCKRSEWEKTRRQRQMKSIKTLKRNRVFWREGSEKLFMKNNSTLLKFIYFAIKRAGSRITSAPIQEFSRIL